MSTRPLHQLGLPTRWLVQKTELIDYNPLLRGNSWQIYKGWRSWGQG